MPGPPNHGAGHPPPPPPPHPAAHPNHAAAAGGGPVPGPGGPHPNAAALNHAGHGLPHGHSPSRLNESLETVRQEFEFVTQELGMLRAQRDDFENKSAYLIFLTRFLRTPLYYSHSLVCLIFGCNLPSPDGKDVIFTMTVSDMMILSSFSTLASRCSFSVHSAACLTSTAVFRNKFEYHSILLFQDYFAIAHSLSHDSPLLILFVHTT
jgi:hypothetical protein